MPLRWNKWTFAAALALTILLPFSGLQSVAAEKTKGSQGQAQKPTADIGPRPIGHELLEDYRAEPGCENRYFDALRNSLAIDDLGVRARIYARRPDALEYGQQAAINYNQAAQVAADKGCPAIARGLWLSVIEQFTGSGYAAQRQRAQIGIDDLRSAAIQPRSPSPAVSGSEASK